MATTSNNRMGSLGTSPQQRPTSDRAQRRRDWMTLAIVLIVFAAMVGLIIWLASLGGAGTAEYGPVLF